jgi:DNA topoisomerase-3
VKIAETGKTDLLPGFVSKKGRKFAAYLKLDGKKVGFEFEPREPKAPKAEGEGSTVKRGRFGKPLKPNLTTESVAEIVEKKTAKAAKPKKAPAKKKVPKTTAE